MEVPSDTKSKNEVLKTEVGRNIEADKQYQDITEAGKHAPNENSDSGSDDSLFRNCKKICGKMCGILDLSLLKIPTFSLFCFAIFLGECGNNIPLGLIPLRLSGMGMSKHSAAMLITYLGMGGAIGKILMGWLADQPWTNRKLMYACAHSFAGCLTFIAYFISNYNALIAYCALFSIASGRGHRYLDLVDLSNFVLLNWSEKIKGFISQHWHGAHVSYNYMSF